MSSNQVTITINATDGASTTFKTIGSSAQGMGTALTTAGNTGSAGLAKLDSATTKAAAGMKTFAAAASGLAGSALVGFLSDAAHAAGDLEAAQSRLDGAIDASGQSVAGYAQQLDAATKSGAGLGFKAADITDALARMTEITGSADAAFASLGAAEDLARARNIDLVAAAQLVGKAYDGNITTLGRMGVVLDKTATGAQNVATIEQKFAGQAQGFAGTIAGSFAQAGVAFGNFQDAIGGLEGPVARIVGLLPGVSAGFSFISTATGAVAARMAEASAAAAEAGAALEAEGAAGAAAATELDTLAASEELVGTNAAAMDAETAAGGASLGVLGAAAGAAVIAIGGLVVAVKGYIDAANAMDAANKLAAQGIGSLTDPQQRTEFRSLIDEMQQLANQGDALGQKVFGQDVQTQPFKDYIAQSETAITNLATDAQKTGQSLTVMGDAVQAAFDAWDSGQATLSDTTTTLGQMDTILTSTAKNSDLVRQSMTTQIEAVRTGNETWQTYSQWVATASSDVGKMGDSLVSSAADLLAQSQAADRTAASLKAADAAYTSYENNIRPGEASLIVPDSGVPSQKDLAAIGAAAGQTDRWTQTLQANTKAAQLNAAEWLAQRDAVLAADQQVLGFTPTIAGLTGALAKVAKPGQNIQDVLDGLARSSDSINNQFADTIDKTSQLGQSMNDAVSGMDAVLSVFKQLDTIGKASQDATDIAQKVVGDPGVYAAVDDLLARGRITLDQYNAAQQQEIGITHANAQIQDDLNVVRTNSIPLLASQEQALQTNADALAAMSQYNPQLAQQTLYLMDSGNAAKLASVYSTAYAESLGQIPPSVATEIIADAAKAEPILEGILQKYGLINVGADGTITVNFPEKATLDDVSSQVSLLTSTNIAIGLALTGDVAGAKALLDRVQAATANTYTITLDAIDQASAKLNPPINIATNFDGTTYTGALSVQDNASQPIAGVATAASNLDGTTATVTVDANTAPFEASIAGLGQNVKPIEIPVVPMQQGVVGVQYTAPKEAPQVAAPAAPPPVPITADISPFTASIQTAEAEGANFAKQTYQAHLGLDLTQFNTQLPSAITDAAGFASQTYQAKLSADSGDAAAAIQTAIQEGEGFAKQTYTATLSAQDNTGDALVNASSNAHAFANAEYQASLTANDAASSIIAIPQAAATAFATTYTGTIETTDNASNVIATATGLALAFATTYSADLECVDNASGVINEVVQELDNVDGKTATTYINTVNTTSDGGPMHAGGGQLGKTIQAMALGGTASGIPVLVGEAGPEIAFLPLGTQVIPHGASVAAMQGGGTVGSTQSSLQPNTAQATSAGQKDGVAYYQGLLSAVKSQKQTLHGEIFGNTLFTSAAAAKPGLDALSNLGQQHDQLVQQLQEARQDQQQLGNAATKAGTSMTTAATSATTAIQGTTQATGKLATMIGKLQGLHSLVGGSGGGAGAVDPIKQAIQSFEQTALSSLGQVQQASQDTGQALNQDIGKGANQAAGQVSNATGQMTQDIQKLPGTASTAGKSAGNAIGQGLSQGIQKSNVSDQISGVQQQLQQLGSTTQGPSIGVNDQQAQQGIQGVQQGLSQLNGQNAAVGVNVNTSQWDKFVQNFKSMDGQSISVTVNQKTNTSGGGGGGGGGKTPPPSGQGGGGGGGKNPPPSGQTPASLNLPLSALVPQAALGRTVTVLPGVPPPVSVAGTGRPTQFVNYGHIHIHPHTADLYQEIAGAFAQMGRW